MSIFPYNLTLNESNSDKYFDIIADVSERAILDAEKNFAGIVNEFEIFLAKENIDLKRSRNEYLIDLLMIGTLWNVYISNAMASKFIITKFTQALSNIKTDNVEKNNEIEKLKNQIINEFLIEHSDDPPTADLNNYTLLLDWLISVSFFNEEVLQMLVWEKFFNQLDERHISETLNNIINYTFDFSDNAFNQLHIYTNQVIDFLEGSYIDSDKTEDIIMRERSEEEYHLNMIANYLLNKAQKDNFKAKPKKIVILPTCIQDENVHESQGTNSSSIPDNISDKIKNLINELNDPNIELAFIPHKDFSKFFAKYTNSEDTAFIVAACALNLMSISFELKRLNINFQILPLDTSGCKKYWNNEGIPSNINTNQLIKLLQ